MSSTLTPATVARLADAVASTPTLYLTNAASRRPPHRGPGRVLTIMAAPRPAYGEAGEGDVPALIPHLPWLRALQEGVLSLDEYRARFEAGLTSNAHELSPGRLYARNLGWRKHYQPSPVRDGDTLICACSREAAREGRCHRVWAAHALARAGWRVVLDGELLEAP